MYSIHYFHSPRIYYRVIVEKIVINTDKIFLAPIIADMK